MKDEAADGVILWKPSDKTKNESRILGFMKHISQKYSVELNTYEDVYAWTITNPAIFWSECWDFVDAIGNKSTPMSSDLSVMIKGQFFPNGSFNFARNCLKRNDGEPAIIFTQENIENRVISWFELRRDVHAVACALRRDGVSVGDRVCAVAANVPETVVCMLATSAIGAIWSSVSPDFGVEGILERFQQIEPKVLFYTESYYNKNKLFNVADRINEVKQHLVSLKSCVLLTSKGITDYACSTKNNEVFEYAPTQFNDPMFIMFSSGTTGKPKCIVHRHGVLLQLMKEHQLHCDINPGDRVFYYTTTTWMMWNWLVGSLASGATIMLYEGNPFYPTSNSLFEFGRECKLLGVSAKFIDSLKSAPDFKKLPHLPNLKTIASTGSALVPESFDFIYQSIKPEVNVASICGGTDILSCFILGSVIKPVVRGFAQCRGLGMDVQIWDPDTGKSLIGEKGELVCCTSFPSMPIGFWGDSAQSTAYTNAYFSDWPNVWKQGDYCLIDSEGHVMVFGRSDATLKPGGVRIGTSEIYRAVESLEFVKEAICCGIELRPGDESVALFVVIQPPYSVLTDEMRTQIRSTVAKSATRHHVPKVIEQVSDIPRTKSGKIVELAVKNVLHGRPIKNLNALSNPLVLKEFEKYAHLSV